LSFYNIIFPKGIISIAGFPQLGESVFASAGWTWGGDLEKSRSGRKKEGLALPRAPFVVLWRAGRFIEPAPRKIGLVKLAFFKLVDANPANRPGENRT